MSQYSTHHHLQLVNVKASGRHLSPLLYSLQWQVAEVFDAVNRLISMK
jgi:hypothetical protein